MDIRDLSDETKEIFDELSERNYPPEVLRGFVLNNKEC